MKPHQLLYSYPKASWLGGKGWLQNAHNGGQQVASVRSTPGCPWLGVFRPTRPRPHLQVLCPPAPLIFWPVRLSLPGSAVRAKKFTRPTCIKPVAGKLGPSHNCEPPVFQPRHSADMAQQLRETADGLDHGPQRLRRSHCALHGHPCEVHEQDASCRPCAMSSGQAMHQHRFPALEGGLDK